MNATSTHTKPAGRVRIVIVDPELRLGLRLADCLATSGYQAVLARDLDSTLTQLGEIQPELILLSQDSSDKQTPPPPRHTSGRQQALPQAPVLTLNRATPENPPGPSQPSSLIPRCYTDASLKTCFAHNSASLACEYSNSASQSSLSTRP